jgi:murein DD-endopeptidase MepM/ murein hydrolase activator NlpD
MMRRKEKTTILFVTKDQKAIKPMMVSSSLIANWKKYVFAIVLVFLGLGSVIWYMVSLNKKQENIREALSQKIHHMHSLLSSVDTAAMKEKFNTIDEELMQINGYLKARGIQTVSKEPQGGDEDDDIISPEEAGDFYTGYLKKIMYNISYTPLGYPYHGDITSTFGHRENPFGGSNVETHKGVDIRAPYGSPVKAMAKGEVEFAGPRGGFGNCIILKHGNGFETLYGHLSKILVTVGQKIDIGQQIGRVGSTGRSTGPHLHYEVHRNGQRINPQPFLTLK